MELHKSEVAQLCILCLSIQVYLAEQEVSIKPMPFTRSTAEIKFWFQ